MSKMEHIHLVGAAEARHRLYQRFENRLEVDQRPADHLEHVGGRRLLLACLFQLLSESSNLFLETRNR